MIPIAVSDGCAHQILSVSAARHYVRLFSLRWSFRLAAVVAPTSSHVLRTRRVCVHHQCHSSITSSHRNQPALTPNMYKASLPLPIPIHFQFLHSRQWLHSKSEYCISPSDLQAHCNKLNAVHTRSTSILVSREVKGMHLKGPFSIGFGVFTWIPALLKKTWHW